MRYLLPFLLLGATACQLPASVGLAPIQQGYDDYGGGWHTEPLRAAVWFDEFTGRASFDLSRPAHVAMFAMQPMGGIEMIYPSWGWSDGRHRAFSQGTHTVRAESRYYRLTSRPSRYTASRRSAGQTYIVLIASDRPLDLGPLLMSGMPPLMGSAATTWSPFVATRYLARQIVSGHGSAEWTAAYHVIWPEYGTQRAMRPYQDGRDAYTTVRCPGGQVVSLHIDVLRGGFTCPDPDDRPDYRPRPTATDGTPIRRVLPDRPRPTDWRGATPTGAVDGRRDTDRPVKRARPVAPGTSRDRPDVPDAAPRTPARPTARPAPATKRPTARTGPVSRRPEARPAVRPQPRPRPAPRPEAKPKPKPEPKSKPKPKSGGGGSGGSG